MFSYLEFGINTRTDFSLPRYWKFHEFTIDDSRNVKICANHVFLSFRSSLSTFLPHFLAKKKKLSLLLPLFHARVDRRKNEAKKISSSVSSRHFAISSGKVEIESTKKRVYFFLEKLVIVLLFFVLFSFFSSSSGRGSMDEQGKWMWGRLLCARSLMPFSLINPPSPAHRLSLIPPNRFFQIK